MPDCRLLGAEPCIERLPLPKRPPRHLRVDRVRPIPASENARMIAGAGARMRHAVRLDDRHARAGLTQMMRGPGPKTPAPTTTTSLLFMVRGSGFEVRTANDTVQLTRIVRSLQMPTLQEALAAHTHDAAPELVERLEQALVDT